MKNSKQSKKNQKVNEVVREWVEAIVIAFILAMVIRAVAFQAFKIPSGSMRPTLVEGDRLLVNKLAYGPRIPFTKTYLPGYTKPKRGDVVVFDSTIDPKKDFIKRLIAFGGETVQIKNGDVYIDGELIQDSKVKDNYYYNRGDYGDRNTVVTVPEDSYFMLGDNSANSEDSRYWGFVPKDHVIGKASVIYWPLNRGGLIK